MLPRREALRGLGWGGIGRSRFRRCSLCGFWQRVRIMHDWGFEAHFFFDKDHPPENIKLINNTWVPQGIERAFTDDGKTGVPCLFQIGSSAFQYQGIALLSSNSQSLEAEGLVDLTISGEGARGPLYGPVAGTIS